MEIVYKKINELVPYEKNPRKNNDAVKYVAESIKQFGFKVPVIIDKNNIIVAGHTRYKASKKLRLKEIPCIIADDLTEEQIKAFRIADNKVAEKAEWDDELLQLELQELEEENFDFQALGFEEELDEILKQNEEITRKDLSENIFEKYEIIVVCDNEEDLQNKYNKLMGDGYNCLISIL